MDPEKILKLLQGMTDEELLKLSPLGTTRNRCPHPRQADFLSLKCEEALYGGAAGGGKTEALLMWLAEGVEVPGYSAIFFRRTFAQLQKSNDSPITKSHELFRPLGGKYKAGEHKWSFPSGATIEFGHMQHENTVMNYQGPAYHRVAFDELTQFSESQYTYLFSRMRMRKDFPIKMGIRAASNPGGPGHAWVKARFITLEAERELQALRAFEPSLPADWSSGRPRTERSCPRASPTILRSTSKTTSNACRSSCRQSFANGSSTETGLWSRMQRSSSIGCGTTG
jgi:hypothetical protein